MKAAISWGFDFSIVSILCCCSADCGDFKVCNNWFRACFCCNIAPLGLFKSPTGLTAGEAPCIGPPTSWPCDCINCGAGDLILWPGNLCHCSIGNRLLPINVHRFFLNGRGLSYLAADLLFFLTDRESREIFLYSATIRKMWAADNGYLLTPSLFNKCIETFTLQHGSVVIYCNIAALFLRNVGNLLSSTWSNVDYKIPHSLRALFRRCYKISECSLTLDRENWFSESFLKIFNWHTNRKFAFSYWCNKSNFLSCALCPCHIGCGVKRDRKRRNREWSDHSKQCATSFKKLQHR